jgi:hypothetical protein
MAPKQKEIIRQLDDGFAVAWDTNEIPPDVQESFKATVDDQIDIFFKALTEEGEQRLVVAQVKSRAKSE